MNPLIICSRCQEEKPKFKGTYCRVCFYDKQKIRSLSAYKSKTTPFVEVIKVGSEFHLKPSTDVDYRAAHVPKPLFERYVALREAQRELASYFTAHRLKGTPLYTTENHAESMP